MPRINKSFYLQKSYVEAIKSRSDDLGRSEGYILEECIWEFFKHILPADDKPGAKSSKNGEDKNGKS